jgi:hypothetical protein
MHAEELETALLDAAKVIRKGLQLDLPVSVNSFLSRTLRLFCYA